MDVFELRDRLVQDYAAYVDSFIQIRESRVRDYVQESLDDGVRWPDPLIQLNPSFEPGDRVDDLVGDGVLHPDCAHIFRRDKGQASRGQPMRLHRHQSEAIRTARGGHNYVLTTGTGSGKSLSYIVPIVDRILCQRPRRGIQAIVVYPMNALVNSQGNELHKFLDLGFPEGRPPVTFGKYTGQERGEQRRAMLEDPPNILLTNYVMLELILTRPGERDLVKAAQGLQFLVLDELHTYRGRQGADVSLLVRRVRDALAANNLQCVGTSATLAGAGTYDAQRAEVATVATSLFGAEVRPEHVIGETLRPATPQRDLHDPQFVRELAARVGDISRRPPSDYAAFVADPLSIWIEHTFGVQPEAGTGRLIRARPRGITGDEGAARELAALTGAPEARCAEAIEAGLLAGYACENPETRFPAFAFRLHQFISRGDTVYASPQPEADRHISLEPQTYVPGDRGRVLLPLAFCRECGQEYYSVRVMNGAEEGSRHVEQRELSDRVGSGQEGVPGFLYHSTDAPWPSDADEMLERLPDDWLEEHGGALRVRSGRRRDLPTPILLAPDGTEGADGLRCQLVSAPFRLCLRCGVEYGSRQTSDFGKLATLSSEGRSTATTILSLSTILSLKADETLPERARKLLSFTDNRQDASLQAGHFNDFVEVGVLRAALHRAARDAGADGLRHDELAQRVFDALVLPKELYAADPTVKYAAETDTNRALRNVLGYRLYRDLKRGWRITSPNLEQTGLLEIGYESLDAVCTDHEPWQGAHPALTGADAETRARVARVLLDFMRRELAIKVDYLDAEYLERVRQQSNQRLRSPWAIDEYEILEHAAVAYSRSSRPADFGGNIYLSPRSGFGVFLRRASTFPAYGRKIGLEETGDVIAGLFSALKLAGLVEVVAEPRGPDDMAGYQVPASALRGRLGGGDPGHAPGDGRGDRPVRGPAAAGQGDGWRARGADGERPAARRRIGAGRLQQHRRDRHPVRLAHREHRGRVAGLPEAGHRAGERGAPRAEPGSAAEGGDRRHPRAPPGGRPGRPAPGGPRGDRRRRVGRADPRPPRRRGGRRGAHPRRGGRGFPLQVGRRPDGGRRRHRPRHRHLSGEGREGARDARDLRGQAMRLQAAGLGRRAAGVRSPAALHHRGQRRAVPRHPAPCVRHRAGCEHRGRPRVRSGARNGPAGGRPSPGRRGKRARKRGADAHPPAPARWCARLPEGGAVRDPAEAGALPVGQPAARRRPAGLLYQRNHAAGSGPSHAAAAW
ncbi:MAG: DEAD/DEAH box helicase [Chloroflexota bacterium]|nr:DEAD/DEAH box helicase [Chloroflexota bacterium]